MARAEAPDPATELARLAGEAHVWLARPGDLHDPVLLEGYHALLSPEEHERYRRFARDNDRHEFLVSHALVRCALSRYAEVGPAIWEFVKGEHDKPELCGPAGIPPLRFNLSHSSGLVACVVCAEVDCGVDVERVGRVKDLAGVAKRILSPGERDALFALDEADRHTRFTDYWSLKEAYAKARGLGFQLPLRDVRFDLESSTGAPSISFGDGIDDEPGHWQIELQPISPEHRLAVALRRGEGRDRPLSIHHEWPHGQPD